MLKFSDSSNILEYLVEIWCESKSYLNEKKLFWHILKFVDDGNNFWEKSLS